MDMIESRSWTGRSSYAGTPLDLLKWRIRSFLYPSFECEQCVGQDHGCYCAYYEAVAPNCGPEKWRVVLRDLAYRWWGIHA